MPQRHGRTLRPDSDRPTLDKDLGAGGGSIARVVIHAPPIFCHNFRHETAWRSKHPASLCQGPHDQPGFSALVSQPWFVGFGSSALVHRYCRLHERSGAPVARHCLSLQRKAGKERQSLSRWGRYHDGWTAACGAAESVCCMTRTRQTPDSSLFRLCG